MMMMMVMMKMVMMQEKMNGTLSCGGKNTFFLLAVPLVSKMAIFSPMELRMKHAKSKTVR